MDERLIKEGMVLNLEYGEGTIINKALKDGKLYVNIAFGDTTLEDAFFKVYSVDFDEEGATFNEMKDNDLYQDLAANWIAEGMIELEKEKENE